MNKQLSVALKAVHVVDLLKEALGQSDPLRGRLRPTVCLWVVLGLYRDVGATNGHISCQHSCSYFLGPGRKPLRTLAPAGYRVLGNYSPQQIIPTQIPVRTAWWDQTVFLLPHWTNNHHSMPWTINPYKLTLLLTASWDKAFLVKSIQVYSRHFTLKSIVCTRLTIAYRNINQSSIIIRLMTSISSWHSHNWNDMTIIHAHML